jgi:hypothetical protein
MKLIITLFLASIYSYGFSLDLTATAAVKKQINVQNVQILSDLNAHSNIEVMVTGMFMNGCYSWNGAEVGAVSEDNVIEVKTYASVFQGVCIMAMTMFSERVSLGSLDAGEYTVKFLQGDGTYLMQKLKVE